MKADAIKHGIRPRKGMLLVSPSRKKIYGRISEVRRGDVVIRNKRDRRIKVFHESIHLGDYTYAESEPDGYSWYDMGEGMRRR